MKTRQELRKNNWY